MVAEREWITAESPKQAQLTGVESHEGAVFATGKRGVLLERTAEGEWETAFRKGPTGDGHNLLDCSITDDGRRVWFSGVSGSFGYYDRETEEIHSHQGPNDYTSGFASVSAVGASGNESVRVTNNSGRVITATVDGEELTVEDSALPGECTSFTEVVDAEGGPVIAGVTGSIYYRAGGEWEQHRLVTTRIEALGVGDAGVAAVTADGTLYGTVPLPESDTRAKRAQLELTNPEELAVTGGTFVAAGRDGGLALVDADGRVAYPDPAPGVTFYGAEITDAGRVLVVGSGGTILEGVPLEPDDADERPPEEVVTEISVLLDELADDGDEDLVQDLVDLLEELLDDDLDTSDLLP